MIKALQSNLFEALCRLEYWTMHYPQFRDHVPVVAAIWRHITRYIVHPRVFKAVKRSLNAALNERKVPTSMQSWDIVDAIGCLCMEMELLGSAMAAVKGKAFSCSYEEVWRLFFADGEILMLFWVVRPNRCRDVVLSECSELSSDSACVC